MDQKFESPLSPEKHKLIGDTLARVMHDLQDKDLNDRVIDEVRDRIIALGITEEEFEAEIEAITNYITMGLLTDPEVGEEARDAGDPELIDDLTAVGKGLVGQLPNEDDQLTVGRNLRTMREPPPPTSFWGRFINWLKRKISS